MRVNKVATQWNSGTTRESNRGHRARIPNALTTNGIEPHDDYRVCYIEHVHKIADLCGLAAEVE